MTILKGKRTLYSPVIGDKYFSRGGTRLNMYTLYFTREKGEEPTLATHGGSFRNDLQLIEAVKEGVVRNNWPKRRAVIMEDGTEYCILRRNKKFPAGSVITIIRELEGTIGSPYASAELVLCALDGIIGKFTGKSVIFFRKLGDIVSNNMICSKAMSIPEVRAGIWPKNLIYGTPDDIYDFLVTNPDYEIAEHTDGWYDVPREARA